MGRKAWLNPRKNKMVAPSVRITKDGVVDVKAHEHEYPNKLKPAKNSKKDKKAEDLLKGRTTKGKEKKETKLDKAKKEMACRMG